MKKWEYKTVFGSVSDRELNKLSKEGWELVTIERNENLMLSRFYFKRVIR